MFTATYNRAHVLHRVYDSLRAQTFRDFEWLVVDDGSTDGTRALIEGWRDEADFPIRYYHQEENQGKHVAYNRAVTLARGRLFLTLDSDDACVAHALDRFNQYWNEIPEYERPKFSAITCLCADHKGDVVGSRFPDQVVDSDSLDCRYRLKVRGEQWGFQRTDVMRKYPFPVPDRRLSHVPEHIVWMRIAREYKTRFINDPLRIYFTDTPSITRPDSRRLTAYAIMLGHQVRLNEHLDYFFLSPEEFLRSSAYYVRFSLLARRTPQEIMSSLRTMSARLLVLAAWLPGFALYTVDLICAACAPSKGSGRSGRRRA